MTVSCFVTIIDKEIEHESMRGFASVPRRGDEIKMAGKKYRVEQVAWNTDHDVVELFVASVEK
jgi:hypothetical protein